MGVALRYRDTVLALAAAGNFSQLGTRLVISPLVPAIIAAFGVSKGLVGLSLTGLWAVFALLQFPSGVLGDRFGERRVIVVGLTLTGVASLMLAAAPSFPAFALFCVVLGAATGLYFSVMASLLTKLFEDVGQALSVHTAGGAIAGLVAPVAAAAVAARFGWRAGIALGAVSVLPTALLVRLVVRSTPPARPDQPMRERFELGALRELVSRPPVAFTMVLSFVTVYVWQSLASFFPTFMVEHWRYTTQEASVALSAVFLLSAVVQPFVGRLSDRIGRDRVLVVAFAAATLGMALLLGPQSLPAAGAAVVLLGLGISWPGVRQARFMDHFGDAERGAGFGLVRTVYMFLGAFGSVITGAVADLAGWTAAYGVVAALLVVGLAALLVNDRLDLGL